MTRLDAPDRTGLDQAKMVPPRKAVEDTIGLEVYYRVERESVECDD